MAKSFMMIGLDDALSADFTLAAKQAHKAPQSVVVDPFTDRPLDRTAGAGISSVEQRRRQEAIDSARSSIQLEGLHIFKEDEALIQRYVDGEIDLDEFVQIDKAHLERG